MFFGTRMQTQIINKNIAIYLDGCSLERVRETKFLGITIDENLRILKKKVELVCRSCSRNIGVLNKVKMFSPTKTMYQLHCSLVLPYINYGLILWALRIVSNSS